MLWFRKKKIVAVPAAPRPRTPADDMRDLANSKQSELIARRERWKKEALDKALKDIQKIAELGYFSVEVRVSSTEIDYVRSELKKFGYDVASDSIYPHNHLHVKW